MKKLWTYTGPEEPTDKELSLRAKLLNLQILQRRRKEDVLNALYRRNEKDRVEAELSVEDCKKEIKEIEAELSEIGRERGDPPDDSVSSPALICAMFVLSFFVAIVEMWGKVYSVFDLMWCVVGLVGMTFFGVAVVGGMEASLKWVFKSKTNRWIKYAITVIVWCAAIFLVYWFIRNRGIDI